MAENYEEAVRLCEKFQPYLFGVISDARFPADGKLDEDAGQRLLRWLRKYAPDIPLLMLSSESKNREKAEQIPAIFLDKNSPNLLGEIRDFFLKYLGFGDFVFRMPDGTEVGRAGNLRELIIILPRIPAESVRFHAERT